MRRLGFDRFALVGHDRGARVAHRLTLDHPAAVERVALFDIAPTATMYARTNQDFATRYFWWFFLIQPAPLPERLIAADPEFFLRTHIDGQNKTPGATSEAVFQEYLRCYSDPACRHAICEGLPRRRHHRPGARRRGCRPPGRSAAAGTLGGQGHGRRAV